MSEFFETFIYVMIGLCVLASCSYLTGRLWFYFKHH